ncbi:MAG: thioesterase [Pirellulales bacterium]|nr:thioesterase [Pirellulales bacterium]
MSAIYPYHHVIGENEVEPDGYVSCLTYLLWTRSAAQEHSAKQGWTHEKYIEIGAAWVVRTHHIDYFRPAFAGEEVVIDTWVSNFGKTRSLRKYLIRRPEDDCVLVTAETNWALVDIAKRRPRRIPQEIIDSFILVPECDEPTPKRSAEPARTE